MVNRYIILPLDPEQSSVCQHLEDVEAVLGLKVQDLVASLLIGRKQTTEPNLGELRELAETCVTNAIQYSSESIITDMEEVFCLVEETLEVLDLLLRRTLSVKAPGENWIPIETRSKGLLVKREGGFRNEKLSKSPRF